MDSGPKMQCTLPLKFFVLFMPIVRPCPVVFILIIFVTSMIPSRRVMFFPLPFRGHDVDSKQSNKGAQPTPVAISFTVVSLDICSIIWLMRYELAFAEPTGRQRCTAHGSIPCTTRWQKPETVLSSTGIDSSVYGGGARSRACTP